MNGPIRENLRLLCVLVANGEFKIFKDFLKFLLEACGHDIARENEELKDTLRFVIEKTLALIFRSCPNYLTHPSFSYLYSYERAMAQMFREDFDLAEFLSEEFAQVMDDTEYSAFFKPPELDLDWMDKHDAKFTIHGYEVLDKFFYVFETKNLVYSGTTGYKTWPASIHLANYIAETVIYSPTSVSWNHGPEEWKNVFEIGSGITGFLGVTMQDVLSSPKWTFADKAMDDGSMIKTNADLNSFPKMDAIFMKHDWDFPLPEDIEPAKLVVATDVIFDPELTIKFLKTAKDLILRLTDDNGLAPDFLLCNAIRNPSSHEHFLENARDMDFDITVLDRWSGLKWARELRHRVAVIAGERNIPLDTSQPIMSAEHVPLTADDTPTVIYSLKLLSNTCE